MASGRILEILPSATVEKTVQSRGYVPLVAGRTYRVTAEVLANAPTASFADTITVGLSGVNEQGASQVVISTVAAVTGQSGPSATLSIIAGWTKIAADITILADNTAPYGRPRVTVAANTSNQAVVLVSSLQIEDATNQLAAGLSAAAAVVAQQSAASHADNSAQQANAASLAATSANTARSDASAFMQQASNASNSANAAMAQASTSMGVAVTSATSAQLAQVKMFPDRYDAVGTPVFQAGVHGAPNVANALPSNATVAGYGPVRSITLGTNQTSDVCPIAVLTPAPGKIYKLEVEFQTTAISGTPNGTTGISIQCRTLDDAYQGGGIGQQVVTITAIDANPRTASWMFSDTAGFGRHVWPAGTVWLRPYARVQSGGTSSITVQVRRVTITDVTESMAAQAASAAAAGFSAAANNFANTAQQNANSATQSAALANTSRSDAASFMQQASNASNSANAANASATSAQGVAVSSSLAARKAASVTRPSTFEDGSVYWTFGATNTGTFVSEYDNTAGVTVVYNNAPAGYLNVNALPTAPTQPGRKWKVRARVQSSTAGGRILLRLNTYNAQDRAGGVVGTFDRNDLVVPTSWGWIEEILTSPANGSFVTVNAYPNYPSYNGGTGRTPSIVKIAALEMIDVTSEEASSASASAAATSASQASSNANTAIQQANAATQQALLANTSRSDAASFMQQAANASNSANAASATANTASGIAVQARNDAQANASAAKTQADTATASANTAGVHASTASQQAAFAAANSTTASGFSNSAKQASDTANAASATANSASGIAVSASTASQTAAGQTWPSDFAQDSMFWGGGTHATERLQPWSASNFQTVAEGRVLQSPSHAWVMPQTPIRPIPNRRYRVTVRIRCAHNADNGGGTRVALDWWGMTSTYADAPINPASLAAPAGFVSLLPSMVVAQDWQTLSSEIVMSGSPPAFVRPRLYWNWGGGGGATDGNSVVRVLWFKIEDVTESVAAAGSASAAKTSSDHATANASTAGTHASTASQQADYAKANTSLAAGYSNTAKSASDTANAASATANSASGIAVSASNAAKSAALQTFPSDMTQGELAFGNGPPDWSGATPWPSSNFVSIAEGRVLQSQTHSWVVHAQPIVPVLGRRYRVTARIRCASNPTNGGGTTVVIDWWGLNGSYTSVGAAGVLAPTPGPSGTDLPNSRASLLVADGWQTLGQDITITNTNNAYLRPRLYWNWGGNGFGDSTIQLLYFKIEDVTNETAAAGSASAAKTQADYASANVTAATSQANTATAARIAAETARNGANANASIATTQAAYSTSNASAAAGSASAAATSASAAQTSAILSASVGNSLLNINPTFTDFPTVTAAPTGWTYEVTEGAAIQRQALPAGGWGMRLWAPAGQDMWVAQATPVNTLKAGDWIVLEVDVALLSGRLTGAGVLFRAADSTLSSSYEQHKIVFSDEPDSTGEAPGNGVGGRSYSWRKLVQIQKADANRATIYAMSHYGAEIGSNAFVANLQWRRCGYRAATSEEIASRRATNNLAELKAVVDTSSGVLADLKGRTEAYWTVKTNAGAGADAFITAMAQTTSAYMQPLSFKEVWPGRATIVLRDFAKNSTGAWDFAMYSEQSHGGRAFVSAQSIKLYNSAMFGLAEEPTANYTKLRYGLFFGQNGQIGMFIGNSGGGTFASITGIPSDVLMYKTTDVYAIHYEGNTVSYKKNGATFATFDAGWNRTFFGGFMGERQGDGLTSINFAAQGPSVASTVSMGAREVHILNLMDGEYKKASSVVGGNAEFSGGLKAGTYIRLGSGTGWPVALAPQDFNVADGTAVEFGVNLGTVPKLRFATDGLAPLGAGETYRLYADNLTATGFIARLKIQVPGTAVQHSVTSSYNPGWGPTRHMDVGHLPQSTNGYYTLTFGGATTMAPTSGGPYDIP